MEALLLNNTPMQDTYGFHLLFLDVVQSVDGGHVPEGFHWYTLQGVDGTLPANTSEVYAYVKLPAIVFFAGINPRRPAGFKNTRILPSGTIKASNQEVRNRVFGEFLVNRAQEVRKLTRVTSARQQSIIRETALRNPERALNSQSYKVFLAEQYWKSIQE